MADAALFGLGLLADEDGDSSSNDRVADDSSSSDESPRRSRRGSKPPAKTGAPSGTTSPDGELGNNTPREVFEGKKFTHDGFVVAPGWQVVDEPYFGATIEDLVVTNTGGDRRIAWFTFRFYDGKTVLTEILCDSNQMQSGETSSMDCGSLDTEYPTGYDTIKVSDAF